MDVSDLTRDLESLQEEVLAAIRGASDVAALEALEVDVLGRKGRLGAVLRGIGGLPAEDRPRVGAVANTVRTAVEAALAERGAELRALEREARFRAERIDVTTPGRPVRRALRGPIRRGRASLAAGRWPGTGRESRDRAGVQPGRGPRRRRARRPRLAAARAPSSRTPRRGRSRGPSSTFAPRGWTGAPATPRKPCAIMKRRRGEPCFQRPRNSAHWSASLPAASPACALSAGVRRVR